MRSSTAARMRSSGVNACTAHSLQKAAPSHVPHNQTLICHAEEALPSRKCASFTLRKTGGIRSRFMQLLLRHTMPCSSGKNSSLTYACRTCATRCPV